VKPESGQRGVAAPPGRGEHYTVCSVDTYGCKGVSLKASNKWCPNPTGKGGGRRGSVGKFSKASRRRMREAMLHLDIPGGVFCGATLTIPVDNPSLSDSKRLWHRFSKAVQRRSWGMIWRVEQQQRGALHWHCIIGSKIEDITDGRDVPEEFRDLAAELFSLSIDALWNHCLVKSDMQTPAGFHHSCDVSCGGGDRSEWLRYLQDHASKSKDVQEIDGMGRHWGIVGRDRFVWSTPTDTQGLNRQEWWVFLRALQRLSTPRRKAACVFGSKLGYRNQRGRWGSSVWFSRAATIKRLVEYARSSSVSQA